MFLSANAASLTQIKHLIGFIIVLTGMKILIENLYNIIIHIASIHIRSAQESSSKIITHNKMHVILSLPTLHRDAQIQVM